MRLIRDAGDRVLDSIFRCTGHCGAPAGHRAFGHGQRRRGDQTANPSRNGWNMTSSPSLTGA